MDGVPAWVLASLWTSKYARLPCLHACSLGLFLFPPTHVTVARILGHQRWSVTFGAPIRVALPTGTRACAIDHSGAGGATTGYTCMQQASLWMSEYASLPCLHACSLGLFLFPPTHVTVARILGHQRWSVTFGAPIRVALPTGTRACAIDHSGAGGAARECDEGNGEGGGGEGSSTCVHAIEAHTCHVSRTCGEGGGGGGSAGGGDCGVGVLLGGGGLPKTSRSWVALPPARATQLDVANFRVMSTVFVTCLL